MSCLTCTVGLLEQVSFLGSGFSLGPWLAGGACSGWAGLRLGGPRALSNGLLAYRQLYHHDRSGFQDSDRGDQRGEGEAADLGHGRTGALPHHHLYVSTWCPWPWVFAGS